MKESDLIKGCIKNNRTAQNELFRQYKDTLFFTSLKYCRNQTDAEDNLHDAFITIFQKIKTFKNTGSFEGWMKRITIYKAIDKYKAEKPVKFEINNDLLEAEVEIEVETDTAEITLDQLLQLIQELPDQYRIVFNLYQIDSFSHKEIASILNISEGTSKSNFHRAKLILREKLEPILKTHGRASAPKVKTYGRAPQKYGTEERHRKAF